MDEQALIPLLNRGEADAWRRLVHELTPPLFRYLRAQTGDDDSASELVQQTFVRLLRARLKAGHSLRAFVFRIATNCLRDSRRRQSTRRKHEQEAAMAEAANHDPARQAAANEAWREALALPDELREVVLLRYGEGFTAAETAAVLGIPEGTVKTRQRKALESLRGSALAVPALLHEGATGAPVPAGLAPNVEAMVMAKVGTKTLAGAGLALLIGGAAALLLLGTAAYVLFNADDTEWTTRPQSEESASTTDDWEGGSAGVPSASASGRPQEFDEPGIAGETSAPRGEASTLQVVPEGAALNEVVIRGRVVDLAGNGIAGAEVSYVIGQKRVASESSSPFLLLGRGTSWLPFEADRMSNVSFERRTVAMRAVHGLPVAYAYSSVNLYHPEFVISDEEGHYEIAVPLDRSRPAYRVLLRATALGYKMGGGDVGGSTRAVEDVNVVERDLTMQRLARVAIFRTEPEVHRLAARVQTSDQGMTGHGGGEVHPGPGGVHQMSIPRGLLSRMTITTVGFAAVDLEVEDDGGRMVDLGVIRLPEGRTITGSVLTTDGKPVANAALRLLCDPPRHAQSGADGSFTIAGAPNEGALLVARHEKFAEAHAEVGGGADDVDGLALTMKRGVKVSVAVRLPRNVDDKVWLALIREMPGPEPREWYIEHGHELDESGRAVFERVAPGTYYAIATIGQRSVHKRVEVRGVDVHVSLEFGTGGRVHGTVIDRDGSPLANEQIRLLRMPQGMEDLRGKTGADGSYAFEDVADGEYIVYLDERDTGFAESFLATRHVAISDGNAVEMNIDYSQRPLGNVLRGRATLGGQPSFEAVILLGAGLTGGTMIGRCEPDGSFEIEGIPPGEYYALFGAAKSRMGPRLPIRFDGWDGEQVIERDFQAVTLELRLQGEDIDHTLVRYTLLPHDDEPFGPDAMGLMPGGGGHDWGDEPVNRIENLPALRYSLTVSAPGFADTVVSVDTIRQREVTIELKRNAGTAVFNAGNSPATVLERAGEDMIRRAAFLLIYREGAVVSRQGFQIQPGELQRATTLAPGSYRGLLLGAGIEQAEVAFDIRQGEATQVELPLRPAARATVHITNAGVAPQQAAVRLYDAASGEAVRPFARVPAFLGGVRAPAEGIDIGPLKAGNYRAVVRLPGYLARDVEFSVKSGEEISIPVTLIAE